MAIDTLLISDELFRHQDVATRSRCAAGGQRKENAGTVRIFSSLHVSGEQLSQLTGIAAILRFLSLNSLTKRIDLKPWA